jgi:hypothetical protein
MAVLVTKIVRVVVAVTLVTRALVIDVARNAVKLCGLRFYVKHYAN